MGTQKINNGHHASGVTEEITGAISRTFEGMPVLEAEKELRITLMPNDIDEADRKSFENCVFARACERQFGSTKIVLMRTRAYIAIPDKDGNMRVERFVIPDEAQEIIRSFDKGKEIKPMTSFYFKPPTKSQTLEYERKKSKRLAKGRKKAKMNNELVEDGGSNSDGNSKSRAKKGAATRNKREDGYTSKPKVMDLDVRNGTGMVHTTNKSK